MAVGFGQSLKLSDVILILNVWKRIGVEAVYWHHWKILLPDQTWIKASQLNWWHTKQASTPGAAWQNTFSSSVAALFCTGAPPLLRILNPYPYTYLSPYTCYSPYTKPISVYYAVGHVITSGSSLQDGGWWEKIYLILQLATCGRQSPKGPPTSNKSLVISERSNKRWQPGKKGDIGLVEGVCV